jgi:pyrroline-5-carboxylate reductase
MARPILLVGAGHMGGALLRGWIEAGIGPVTVIEPSPALRKLAGVAVLKDIADATGQYRACVVALKPQILKSEAVRLKRIADSGAPMISIAAGTTIGSLAKAWGPKARILRAMPNLPGAIGQGISALYAGPNIRAQDKALAQSLLGALGETVWVARESMIDVVTAVSGSGPAYVFLLVEALAEAAQAQGLPRVTAERLARATITGSGALLAHDRRPAGILREGVTSPGGTTEAALRVLMAGDRLKRLMARAISAARKRAKQLGKGTR